MEVGPRRQSLRAFFCQGVRVKKSLRWGRRFPSTPRPMPTLRCLSYALGTRVVRLDHPAVPRLSSPSGRGTFFSVRPVPEGLLDIALWRPRTPQSQSFTGLWIATCHAFPCAESAEEVLSFRFLCDGRKHRLVRSAAEAVDEGVAFARAAIDTKLLMASLHN